MNTLSFSDMHQLERNKSLARQTESLRGVTFSMKGNTMAEFVVFTTEIMSRGETQIVGICTHTGTEEFPKKPSTSADGLGFIPGQFYKFDLTHIIINNMLQLLKNLQAEACINGKETT